MSSCLTEISSRCSEENGSYHCAVGNHSGRKEYFRLVHPSPKVYRVKPVRIEIDSADASWQRTGSYLVYWHDDTAPRGAFRSLGLQKTTITSVVDRSAAEGWHAADNSSGGWRRLVQPCDRKLFITSKTRASEACYGAADRSGRKAAIVHQGRWRWIRSGGGRGQRLGLVSMESAHLLNAGLQIESKPDHGPQIEATVRIG